MLESDPGFIRLRLAARGTLAPLLAVALSALIGTRTAVPPLFPLALALLSLMNAMLVSDPKPVEKAKTLFFACLPSAALLSLGTRLADAHATKMIIFLVVTFVSILARRAGSRGLAVGMTAFVSYFATLFFPVQASDETWLIAAAPLAAALGAAAHLFFIREDPEMILSQRVTAHLHRLDTFATQAAKADANAGAYARPGVFETKNGDRLLRRLLRLSESALGMEEQLLAETQPRLGARLMQSRLFEVELEAAALFNRIQAGIPIEPGAADALRKQGEGFRRAASVYLAHLRSARKVMAPTAPARPAAAADADLPSLAIKPSAAVTIPKTSWHPSWRLAIQATLATGISGWLGYQLSPERWNWAAATAFVMFVAQSRADTLRRSVHRVFGTLFGVAAGLVLATATAGISHLGIGLCFVSVFVGVYLNPVSYLWSTFSFALLVALLFGWMGVLTPALMLLRLEETAIGAAAASLVSFFILPARGGAAASQAMSDFLGTLASILAHPGTSHSAAAALGEAPAPSEAHGLPSSTEDPAEQRFSQLRRLERDFHALRAQLVPFLDPWLSPRAARYSALLHVAWGINHYARAALADESTEDGDFPRLSYLSEKSKTLAEAFSAAARNGEFPAFFLKAREHHEAPRRESEASLRSRTHALERLDQSLDLLSREGGTPFADPR